MKVISLKTLITRTLIYLFATLSLVVLLDSALARGPGSGPGGPGGSGGGGTDQVAPARRCSAILAVAVIPSAMVTTWGLTS